MRANEEILAFLNGYTYDTVERYVTVLLQSEQPPVWAVGRHRGVSSKIDVLYGIHRLVTPQDLNNFFFTARLVLSERDPSLHLPEDQRYAASMYGKTPDQSRALPDGLFGTPVL